MSSINELEKKYEEIQKEKRILSMSNTDLYYKNQAPCQ